MEPWGRGEEEARPVCTHPGACPTGPCRRGQRNRGPGGPYNLRIKEEKEEDDDEKKEDDEVEEEMEGQVEEGIMVNFPLVPFPLVSSLCSSGFKIIFAKKKLIDHILEMYKDPR